MSKNFDLAGSLGYTGFTIFFISISFICAMFFLTKFQSKPRRLFLSVIMIFNIIILILANSRGGIIAAILSVFFIFMVLKKSLIYKIFLTASVIALFIFLIIPSVYDYINVYLRWETVSDRDVYWQTGLDVIHDHPVFGLGPDLFDKYFFNYAPSSIIHSYGPDAVIVGKPHPHNFFLYFTAENGAMGMLTSILFFMSFFYFAFKTIHLTRNINNDYFVLATAITGIGIGIFIRSFIEITGYLTYGFITKDLPFWLVFGILISIFHKFNAPPSVNKNAYQ